MSNVRNKDTGTYAPHATADQPGVEKLDLRNTTRPVVNNFQRGNLGPDKGRARPTMPADSQGPDVQWGPTVAPQ